MTLYIIGGTLIALYGLLVWYYRPSNIYKRSIYKMNEKELDKEIKKKLGEVEDEIKEADEMIK